MDVSEEDKKKQSENSVLNPIQYCEIEVITDEIAEYQTFVQKLQLRRHFFDKKIDLELSNEELQIYFELDGVSHHKLKLNHSYFEATRNIMDIRNILTQISSEINLPNDFVKLRYIRELDSKLGIIHSNIEGVVIDRNTVENIDASLLKEESTISDVFNLTIIKNDKKIGL